MPVLGPLTAMMLEAQTKQGGWHERFAVNLVGLGLQSVGASLAVFEELEDDVVEGPVTTFRPTRVSFRPLEGGGVVTVSGVTF